MDFGGISGEDELGELQQPRGSTNVGISPLTRERSLHGRKLATVDSTEVRAAVLLDKRNAKGGSKRMTDLKLNKQGGSTSPFTSEWISCAIYSYLRRPIFFCIRALLRSESLNL